MQITDNQNNAINEIIEMTVSVVGKGSRELNTTEAISCVARLAGSFLFRSFELKVGDVKPGTVMLSHEANTKGPQLVNITHAALQNFDIQIDNEKMSKMNRHISQVAFLDDMNRIQTPALAIMKNNDLSYE